VRVGGVYDPNRDELFLAKKGEGAYCNGIKISVKNETELEDLIVNIGSPYSTENFRLTYPMEKVFYEKGARMVNFGSAALEGVWVASGRLGAYFEAGLKPWDIAAVQLIVSEAGGRMVDPYNVGNFSVFNQKAVVIGNEKIVNKILKFW
jgi:myo-inositol-1(or 4)-monophosphatase